MPQSALRAFVAPCVVGCAVAQQIRCRGTWGCQTPYEPNSEPSVASSTEAPWSPECNCTSTMAPLLLECKCDITSADECNRRGGEWTQWCGSDYRRAQQKVISGSSVQLLVSLGNIFLLAKGYGWRGLQPGFEDGTVLNWKQIFTESPLGASGRCLVLMRVVIAAVWLLLLLASFPAGMRLLRCSLPWHYSYEKLGFFHVFSCWGYLLWTALLELVYLALLAITTWMWAYSAAPGRCAHVFAMATWFLHSSMPDLALFALLMCYLGTGTLLFEDVTRETPFTDHSSSCNIPPMLFVVHGGANYLCALFSLSTTRLPFRRKHFWVPLGLLFFYSALAVIDVIFLGSFSVHDVSGDLRFLAFIFVVPFVAVMQVALASVVALVHLLQAAVAEAGGRWSATQRPGFKSVTQVAPGEEPAVLGLPSSHNCSKVAGGDTRSAASR